MNPQEFYEKMSELKMIIDIEDRHIKMDALMCDVLKSLGYEKGVEVFNGVNRWYK